jgi:hypothetical protein
MAINKNHEFEDLNGVKCSIVERNVSPGRAAFLKDLLEINGFEVITVTPEPKPAAPVATAPPPDGALPAEAIPPVPVVAEPPTVFTVGVTNVMFNPVNAIFGRLLKTRDGHVVTLAYWEQQENEAQDEIPYFENPNSYPVNEPRII